MENLIKKKRTSGKMEKTFEKFFFLGARSWCGVIKMKRWGAFAGILNVKIIFV